MVPIELESLRSPMVRAILVSQKVGVGDHLGNDWAVLVDLPLDVFFLNRNAEVGDLVDLVVDSALVCFEVVYVAFTGLAVVRQALLGDESLLAAPVEHLVHVTAFAPILARVAVYQLLWR